MHQPGKARHPSPVGHEPRAFGVMNTRETTNGWLLTRRQTQEIEYWTDGGVSPGDCRAEGLRRRRPGAVRAIASRSVARRLTRRPNWAHTTDHAHPLAGPDRRGLGASHGPPDRIRHHDPN